MRFFLCLVMKYHTQQKNGVLEPWQPCLVRNFNHDVAIPNMVDVALALTSRSLEELGGNLFSIASYVRAYIGMMISLFFCFILTFLN